MDLTNTEKFVEEILNLMQNKEQRKLLEEKAVISVKKYDWDNVGNLYLDIYQIVLNKSK